MLCRNWLECDVASAKRGLANRYAAAWESVKRALPTVYAEKDTLRFDSDTLTYLDDCFDSLDLHSPEHDILGYLYESFLGSSIRGAEGQFFTPQNAVELLIDLCTIQSGSSVIDPACGSAGFLGAVARRYLAEGLEPAVIAKQLTGIDKDEYLARMATIRLALLTGYPPTVHCADSLAWRGQSNLPPLDDYLADVVLTNPPFGSKIVAASPATQATFELGYQWRLDRKRKEYVKSQRLHKSAAPQVLFVERCLSLLRPGGTLGIVLPESLVSSPSHRYVMDFVRRRADIVAVVGMPESLFKTSGKGGTHTKTCLVVGKKHDEGLATLEQVFMAEVKWCGNDSRGRRFFRDELPEVAARFASREEGGAPDDHLGYQVRTDSIVENILAPRYYNPEVARDLERLIPTHELVRIGDLVDRGELEIRTGDEIGKEAYGTGTVPFVRTSDISNWEIKLDPKHGVSDDIYQQLASKQDVREGDILMVRDGTYLIGTCAYVTRYDEKIGRTFSKAPFATSVSAKRARLNRAAAVVTSRRVASLHATAMSTSSPHHGSPTVFRIIAVSTRVHASRIAWPTAPHASIGARVDADNQTAQISSSSTPPQA